MKFTDWLHNKSSLQFTSIEENKSYILFGKTIIYRRQQVIIEYVYNWYFDSKSSIMHLHQIHLPQLIKINELSLII